MSIAFLIIGVSTLIFVGAALIIRWIENNEREFRGFGKAEQWDTEEYASLEDDDTLEDK